MGQFKYLNWMNYQPCRLKIKQASISKQETDFDIKIEKSKIILTNFWFKGMVRVTQSGIEFDWSDFFDYNMRIPLYSKFTSQMYHSYLQDGPYYLTCKVLENKLQYTLKFYPDGSIYLGNMKNQMKQGLGVYYDHEKQQFIQGVWNDDEATGPARIIFYNGNIYEGELKKGIANGYGIYKSIGLWIEGIWKNNQMNGQGIMYKRYCFKYIGNFDNCTPNGYGTIKFLDGRKYVGEIKQGEQQGKGKMYFSDGSVYEGPFDENVLYGHGVYKDKDLILKKEFFGVINDTRKLYILYYYDENRKLQEIIKNISLQNFK